jgi:hypothetical protein
LKKKLYHLFRKMQNASMHGGMRPLVMECGWRNRNRACLCSMKIGG